MGATDKEYIQALAVGQKFQVEFKPGTEAAKLSGEYRATEIKSGRGRGGTLNVTAVDMSGHPMPDVPIEDHKSGVVIADRSFGTSAWPMVQKFSIEGKLIYEATMSNSGRETAKTNTNQKPSPLAREMTAAVSRPSVTPRKAKDTTPTFDDVEQVAVKSAPDVTSISEKGAFHAQRTQLTNARTHAMAQQPAKVRDCLLPLLESRGNKQLLLRFSVAPLTHELNGDYSVVSYKKIEDGSSQTKLAISLQSLDIPNKTLEFETDRVDIHIKRIEEITAAR